MAHEITIPRLGWSMEEGTFVGWLKQDGDPVKSGEPLFELEGEKALQEVEAVDEGFLRIPPHAPEIGTLLKVGTVLGYITSSPEECPWDKSSEAAPTATQAQESVADNGALPPPAGPALRRMAREMGVPVNRLTGSGPGGRILEGDLRSAAPAAPQPQLPPHHTTSPVNQTPVSSPRARRAAQELGVDYTRLQGSGAGGRIREVDVRSAAARGPATMPATGSVTPLTGHRRVIADRMLASHLQTAPVTLTTRADAENLVSLREQFKKSGKLPTVPSYQDIICKLATDLLPQHPLLAARWLDNSIQYADPSALHLGMAVDTPQGLVVPVIRNVCSMTLAELAQESRRLVGRAQAGKLSAEEMQGSVFTITNLGAFGIDAFTPVINLPEAAILGLGAIRREAVVQPDGQITSRHQLTLSLTFDHRVLDGAPAARFLQELSAAIASPSACLLNAPVSA